MPGEQEGKRGWAVKAQRLEEQDIRDITRHCVKLVNEGTGRGEGGSGATPRADAAREMGLRLSSPPLRPSDRLSHTLIRTSAACFHLPGPTSYT